MEDDDDDDVSLLSSSPGSSASSGTSFHTLGLDDHVDEFERLFGTPPRPQQITFLRTAVDAVTAHESMIAELPTGTGKTMCSFYACHVALRSELYKRCILSCGETKVLQRQYMDMGAKLQGTIGSVFVLYGSDNYCCERAVSSASLDALEELTEQQERGVRIFFGSLLQLVRDHPDPSALHWSRSMKDEWTAKGSEEMRLAPDVVDRVWERMCYNKDVCDCRNRAFLQAPHNMLGVCFCPYARSRLLKKSVDIVIVNTSYLMRLSAYSGLTRSFVKENERCFLCLDEGHTLPDTAEAAINSTTLPSLKVAEMEVFVTNVRGCSFGRRNVRNVTLDRLRGTRFVWDQCLVTEPKKSKDRERLEKIRTELASIDVTYDASAFHVVHDRLCAVKTQIDKHVPTKPQELAEILHLDAGRKCVFTKADLDAQFHPRPLSDVTTDNAFFKRVVGYLQSKVYRSYMDKTRWSEYARELVEYFEPVYDRANPVPFFETLWNQFDHTRTMMHALTFAKQSVCVTEWTADESYRTQAPIVNGSLVYRHTIEVRAERMHALLEFDDVQPLVMSATLRDENGTFDTYERIIGSTFTHRLVVPSPFRSEQRTFVVPKELLMMGEWTEAYGDEQTDCIRECTRKVCALLPTRPIVFVVGASKEKLDWTRQCLQTKLPEWDHLVFEDRHIDTLKTTTRRTFVYGSKKLSTGIDLPGKIGCLILLSYPVMGTQAQEHYERQHLEQSVKDLSKEAHAWNAYNFFRQACGRPIRNHDDRAVILCFGGQVTRRIECGFGKEVDFTNMLRFVAAVRPTEHS